jgi:hypothetical protein
MAMPIFFFAGILAWQGYFEVAVAAITPMIVDFLGVVIFNFVAERLNATQPEEH